MLTNTITDNILIQTHSEFCEVAYFADRQQAEEWALQQVGDRNSEWSVTFASKDHDFTFVPEVCAKLDVDGLWRAYVSNVELSESVPDEDPEAAAW